MASKRRNMSYQNKKQETTEIANETNLMNREEEKSRSTCSEDGDRSQDKLANISTLGHQLTQLEAHLRRSLETQAEKEKQIAHLKEALQGRAGFKRWIEEDREDECGSE
ncbi:hypothetical protein AAG570_013571 [Ranatra chinensis]|uniref:Uncharacterized protein n=1 Tax=Ranatra chinensis TaxID=642074 RepID=A0ABD0YDA2_9HEMI